MPKLVNIVFPLPVEQAFTYIVPRGLEASAQIGSRIIAPLGPRHRTGFIVSFQDKADGVALRELDDVLDIQPIISTQIMMLAEWISRYYLCSLGEALRATIPSVFLQSSKHQITLRTDRPEHYVMLLSRSAPRQSQILQHISLNGKTTVDQLKKKLGAKSLYSSLNQLRAKQLIELTQVFSSRTVKPRTEKYVELAPPLAGLSTDELLSQLKRKAPRQAACMAFLQKRGGKISQRELLRSTGAQPGTILSLENQALIKVSRETVFRDYYDYIKTLPPQVFDLNQEQKQALGRIYSAIDSQIYKTFLLFGVTGSGKTQVYIEAIARTLRQGRDAIVLVPEISLTPQTVQRFRAHFQKDVAVLHSAMSAGERYDSWHKIKKGGARVVIGPRSAIFAPLENVGLIVVDEEHESSYKQSDVSPRYHARDLAIVRAQQSNAVVVLGSATPSSESFYNAQTSKYKLLQLLKRVNDVAMPAVKIIDMMKERRLSGNKGAELIFSRILVQKIKEKIALNEQIILLLNRRGFSSYIKCHDCGFVEVCNNCNISLTYHLSGRRLRCHYCGFSKKAPPVCPKCSGLDIIFKGLGTQQVEEQLKTGFPDARLVRMDRDTTSRKRAHDKILSDFGAGKYNILLGTQMVAKGLDFSRVTLVGVINGDVGMLVPDFRASERTFQLLTQVAGRAGRKDLTGEVVIQTYSPDNFCLLCAQTHDFMRFYSGEIDERRGLHYPPFGRLICLHFRGEDENKVRQAAGAFADILQGMRGSLQILGPSPSPIDKIQNNYRYQILIKGQKRYDAGARKIRDVVKRAHAEYMKRFSHIKVTVNIDVDPTSIM